MFSNFSNNNKSADKNKKKAYALFEYSKIIAWIRGGDYLGSYKKRLNFMSGTVYYKNQDLGSHWFTFRVTLGHF